MSQQATIHIDTQKQLGRIDRNIFGHFLEGNFYGNIHGGIFEEGSPLSEQNEGVTKGFRLDVIEALRALRIPVVRWPGGNYASAYHWEDGIGPRDRRPRRLELTWGRDSGNPLAEEDNRFGTDEFLTWCDAIGTQPYLNNNCRSVEEAARWVEYTNYGGDTHYTRLREANGQREPYGVRYWGLGNEVYGPWQMGHRSAEQYASDAREHGLFMRRVDPGIKLIGVGSGPRHATEAWTRALLEGAGPLLDYVSIHLYGASRHLFSAGSGDDEYEATVAQPLYFEEELRAYATLVALEAVRVGLKRPLSLALDEWNIRHMEPATWPDSLPGEDGGIAPRDLPETDAAAVRRLRVNRWSPRTAADALFYAGVFHGIQRLSGHAVPVRMANTVNLINANGLLAVRPGGMVKSTTYYVWDLLQQHTGPVALPVTVEGPSTMQPVRWGPVLDAEGQFRTRPGLVPYLDVASSRAKDRRTLFVSVINRHRTQEIASSLVLDGRSTNVPRQVQVVQLGADVSDVLASNTISDPHRVVPHDLGTADVSEGGITFPPHSLTVLSFSL